MTRFSEAQFARAAAAGSQRPREDFANDDDWHAYQTQWVREFLPEEQLPQVGDKQRRLVWKAATRQHGKIEAARKARAALKIQLVPAPQMAVGLGGPPRIAVVADPVSAAAAAASAAAAAAAAGQDNASSSDGARATVEGISSFAASALVKQSYAVQAQRSQSQTTDWMKNDDPVIDAERLASIAQAGSPPKQAIFRGDEAAWRSAARGWLEDTMGFDWEWEAARAEELGRSPDVYATQELYPRALDNHRKACKQLEQDASATSFSAVIAAAAASAAARRAESAVGELEDAVSALDLQSTSEAAASLSALDQQAEAAEQLACLAAAAEEAAAVAAEVAACTRTASAAAALPAHDRFVINKHLQVRDAWMRHHASSIETLELDPPVLTPTQQHVHRRLVAHGEGPDGEPLVASDRVQYSLAPMEGERDSAAGRRGDRHLHREQEALKRLDRKLDNR